MKHVKDSKKRSKYSVHHPYTFVIGKEFEIYMPILNIAS